jgi:hypothetical protein
MSRISDFRHPLDIVHHPQLEPEVKRAILASWASDRSAVEGKPSLRRPPGREDPVPVDEILGALCALDRRQHSDGTRTGEQRA